MIGGEKGFLGGFEARLGSRATAPCIPQVAVKGKGSLCGIARWGYGVLRATSIHIGGSG